MAGPMSPLGQKKVPNNYTGNTNNKGIASSQGIYVGVVKKNDDSQHMGRLQVWIEEFGGDPEDQSSWIGVSYASPFGGTTSIYDQGTNVKEYDDTIKSYGFWAVPPDLGARVIVGFAAGKLDKGYWFACLFQRGTQVSIPGIPAKKTWTGDNKPAAPKNKKDPDADLEKYVEHKPMSNALKQQGLADDPLRGTTSSGVTRETPSKVLGILTPGQHQFVMDDGDKDGNSKLIRLRTTNGTQLLLDDTSGHVYIISKAGESWMELSADGRVHIYGSKDISIRTEENLNLYADKNVNIEAGMNVNIKSGADIRSEAAENIKTLAGANTTITSNASSHISSVEGHYESASVIHMNGPAAETSDALELNSLAVNQGVTESICSTVPEHEPWNGHSGSISPVGLGNQQMQEDPAPEQTPRQPDPEEEATPINKTDNNTEEEMALNEVTTSDNAQAKIKENNKFSPVNYDDGQGQSGGFGSKISDTPASDADQTDTETDKLNARNAEAETQALSTVSMNGSVSKNLKEQTGTKVLDTINSLSSNANLFTNGITANKANELFANDLKSNENNLKKLLSGSGVSNIPQNVFDGLMSFQNQTGDASYAYIKGEKIDLTGMYKNKEWDRAAGFIAADERDRPRRIQEAAMITNNDYGKIASEEQIVNAGLKKAAEALRKGQLNKQTGNATTPQQAFALGSSYLSQTGKTLPGLSFATNSIIKANALTGEITQVIKKQQGPWPY
jgi:GH24 family phage-related lysozyme (muramidase)